MTTRINVHKRIEPFLRLYASAVELHLHKQNNATRRNLRQRSQVLACAYIDYNDAVIVDMSLRVGIYA